MAVPYPPFDQWGKKTQQFYNPLTKQGNPEPLSTPKVQTLQSRVLEACVAGAGCAEPAARQVLLAEALEITSLDRNAAYGEPEDNFANIAAYWNSYCQQRFKVALDITPQDVAHFMILMKMARLATNAQHRDSLVDIAGYAACAEDCRAGSTG